MVTRRIDAPMRPRRRPGPAPRPGVNERLAELSTLRLSRPLSDLELAEETRLYGTLYFRIRRESQRQATAAQRQADLARANPNRGTAHGA